MSRCRHIRRCRPDRRRSRRKACRDGRYTGINYVCNGAESELDADTFDGIDSAALVRTNQFDGLFNSRFDSTFGSLFGTDNSTTSNGRTSSADHYLAEVYLTAANFPPNGTPFAAGQRLSIQNNTALFSLIGTTYGGNGSTTFARPPPAGTPWAALRQPDERPVPGPAAAAAST